MTNGNDAPIFAVTLTMGYSNDTNMKHLNCNLLGHGNVWYCPLVPAQQQYEFRAVWVDKCGTPLMSNDARYHVGNLRAAFEWIDSAGQRWSRSGYDEPIAQDESPS